MRVTVIKVIDTEKHKNLPDGVGKESENNVPSCV